MTTRSVGGPHSSVTYWKDAKMSVAPARLPAGTRGHEHAASSVYPPVSESAPASGNSGTGGALRCGGGGDFCRAAALRLHRPRRRARAVRVVSLEPVEAVFDARAAVAGSGDGPGGRAVGQRDPPGEVTAHRLHGRDQARAGGGGADSVPEPGGAPGRARRLVVAADH